MLLSLALRIILLFVIVWLCLLLLGTCGIVVVAFIRLLGLVFVVFAISVAFVLRRLILGLFLRLRT